MSPSILRRPMRVDIVITSVTVVLQRMRPEGALVDERPSAASEKPTAR